MGYAVPMTGIVLETIVRSKIEPSSEPPLRTCMKKADVSVRGGHERIFRMENERNAHGFPRLARKFGSVRCGRSRQRRSGYVRKTYTSFFEDSSGG